MDDAGKPYDLSQARCCVIANTGSGRKAGASIADLRLTLRANEARGGPIAGSLGYSPDQPFMANALVNGEIVNATVKTGEFTPLIVRGVYGKDRTRISGFADFSGSDLLAPFAERVGRRGRPLAVGVLPTRRARLGRDGERRCGQRRDQQASDGKTTSHRIPLVRARPSRPTRFVARRGNRCQMNDK